MTNDSAETQLASHRIFEMSIRYINYLFYTEHIVHILKTNKCGVNRDLPHGRPFPSGIWERGSGGSVLAHLMMASRSGWANSAIDSS